MTPKTLKVVRFDSHKNAKIKNFESKCYSDRTSFVNVITCFA